ncbi:TIR domain-containing protein [Reyranella sp.]|uniref:TIR domain-containing protein n=2 Tax=Reyranella sp. TaxID=1929291 RepID=UPI004036D8FD
MSLKITGLEALQRQMKLFGEITEALNGEIANVHFDPADHASVELAISEMKLAIDQKTSAFGRSKATDAIVAQIKKHYETEILRRAAAARHSNEATGVSNEAIDQTIFRQIENTVSDLRSADSNIFERHIKKLSRLLHSPTVEKITKDLTAGLDLDAWIAAGEKTQSSMIGSATLEWPSDIRGELGLVILLIDRFADSPNGAIDFSFTFFNAGNNVTACLQSMVAQMIVPFARDYIGHVKAETGTQEPTLLPVHSGPAARKVFIVHGHDEGAREAVARFLERLGFAPIILHEQANQGRTIIEKIEAHGDVGFAVILLTPDDVGAVKGGEPLPRARQNVLLELGYFVGRLGRSRVCALKRGDIEVPSDFGGVVYEPFDAGGSWKQALSRELEAAGFDIDWNVAMKPQH